MRFLYPEKKIEATIVGLERSGKTTMAKGMKNESVVVEDYGSTMCVDVELMKKGRHMVKLYDLGGQLEFRDKWHLFIEDLTGGCVFFVVDSADRERINESVKEFEKVSIICGQKGIPLVLVSNKIDLEGHLSLDEIRSVFKIDEVNGSVVAFEISALKYLNVSKVLEWLLKLS